jgi:hypothetical protein
MCLVVVLVWFSEMEALHQKFPFLKTVGPEVAEAFVQGFGDSGTGGDLGDTAVPAPSTPTRSVRPIVLPDQVEAPAGMDEEGRALWAKLAPYDQQQVRGQTKLA